jgi:succinate dehydrogenase/fumarate reductase flavoprotein subunit
VAPQDDRNATQKDLDELHRRFDEHYAERMDRIEKKLDELTNAVVSIARAEEKIVVLIEDTAEIKLIEDTAEIKAAVNSHTNRIHELELDVSKNKSNLKSLFNFFWTAVGAVTTVLVAMAISNILPS